MSVRHTSDEVELSVTRIETPPIVVQGLEVIVPESPIGEVGVLLDARMVAVEVIPLDFTALAGTAGLITAPGAYMGHSLVEASGAAVATLAIIDGTDAKGVVLCPITLQPNESTRDWFPLPGVSVRRGIVVQVTVGSVSGVVYFGTPAHHHHDREL